MATVFYAESLKVQEFSSTKAKLDYSTIENRTLYNTIKEMGIKERKISSKRARVLRKRGETVFVNDEKELVWFMGAPKSELIVSTYGDITAMQVKVDKPVDFNEKYNEAIEFYQYGKLTKIVCFGLHPADDNFYRKNTSYKAFCKREQVKLSKLIDNWSEQVDLLPERIHVTSPSSIELLEIISESVYKNVPKVYVDSVWEMYKEIGYDIKTQKYVGV